MTLKLKSLFVAALLASGGAFAAPAMQSCSPMEILHSGTAGLSYSLECSVGDWRLKYVGSVPAGTDPVTVQYRVSANNVDGSSFSEVRKTRLLSPAHLGQALLREAVVLDDGALAMRDCNESECSLYRPLGSQSKMTKATITVTPQLQALMDEKEQLGNALAAKQAELADRNRKVTALESDVKALQNALAQAREDLKHTNAQSEAKLSALKTQFDADLAGLSAADKAEREKLEAQAKKTLQANESAVASLSTEGVRTQEALADAIKARDSALAEKDALAQALSEKDALIRDMNQDMELLARLYKEAADGAFVLLDKYQVLEREKQTLEGNLNDMHNQLTLANTKVEAATLARDLAMQAAEVAHLDAGTLHTANQKLGQMLNEKDATIQRLTEAAKSGASQAPVVGASETSKPAEPEPSKTDARAAQKKADKLQAQLLEVLPELYALRYKVEKAEKQRDEAQASLKELQNAAQNHGKSVKTP